MPLYAYTCTACGHSFDIHQSFSDDTLTVCPECEGHLRKVFSPVGVVFKGSGFYRTDNKKSTGSAPSTPKPASEKTTSDSSSTSTSTSSPSPPTTSAPAQPSSSPAPATTSSTTPAA